MSFAGGHYNFGRRQYQLATFGSQTRAQVTLEESLFLHLAGKPPSLAITQTTTDRKGITAHTEYQKRHSTVTLAAINTERIPIINKWF